MNIRYIVMCVIVGIAALFMIACGLGAGPSAGGPPTGQLPGGRPGDDQPIVVVGGSLHVSAFGGEWKRNSAQKWEHNDSLTHQPSKRYVTKIVILHVKGDLPAVDKMEFDNKEPIQIKINDGLTLPKLLLETDNIGSGLTLADSGTVDPMYPEVVSFMIGPLQSIDVGSPSASNKYSCGKQGRCTLVITYCKNAGSCR